MPSANIKKEPGSGVNIKNEPSIKKETTEEPNLEGQYTEYREAPYLLTAEQMEEYYYIHLTARTVSRRKGRFIIPSQPFYVTATSMNLF